MPAVISDLKPYREYKESGLAWLGRVPEHWEVRRLRQLIKGRLTYGANAAAEFTNRDWPRYIRITDFSADGSLRDETFRSLPPGIARDYLVDPGDILLARSGATVGKAFLLSTAQYSDSL
jgi:type I restriction enzyme S subunit